MSVVQLHGVTLSSVTSLAVFIALSGPDEMLFFYFAIFNKKCQGEYEKKQNNFVLCQVRLSLRLFEVREGAFFYFLPHVWFSVVSPEMHVVARESSPARLP